MSSRIQECFRSCQDSGRAALIGYLTAHDPDYETSKERIFAACEAGLDMLELGLPFSDPNADGPAIQSAMVRALESGCTVDRVLKLAEEIRARFDLPLILFGYANALIGSKKGSSSVTDRVQQFRRVGLDAVLAVDVPPEEAQELRDPVRSAELDWIGLCAPTSTAQRIKRIASGSSGFLYAVSLSGVTGTNLNTQTNRLEDQLALIRKHSNLPISVGFGIRAPEQVQDLARKKDEQGRALVDGVVVGSALVRAASESSSAIADLVKSLAAATTR